MQDRPLVQMAAKVPGEPFLTNAARCTDGMSALKADTNRTKAKRLYRTADSINDLVDVNHIIRLVFAC